MSNADQLASLCVQLTARVKELEECLDFDRPLPHTPLATKELGLLVPRAQWEAMVQRAEAAEAKIALGLERMRELLNRDLNTGQLWWQDREAIVGVVLALEVGEGTKPVECTARPYECTDGPYGRTHGADCPLSTTTGQVTG